MRRLSPYSLKSMEEAQKHLACLLQSGIHAFKSQQKMYGPLKCPFLRSYLFHEFSKISFLPTLFLQDSLQIKVLFAARDCQNLIASYSPYMGDSYRILCHSRKSPGSQQCLGSWNITWNQSVLKYQAQLLIYRKIVASSPLSLKMSCIPIEPFKCLNSFIIVPSES